MIVKSLWHTSPMQSEIRVEHLNFDYRSVCSMISTGTEKLVAKGHVNNSFADKMSVPNMKGNFDLPIMYGYSLIVQDHNGRLGHIMHPHQDKIKASEQDIYWIDIDIPASRFALISNMETVINAIWDSNPSQSDRIAICGFGNIGALLANTLRLEYNIEVEILEIDEWRMDKAKSMHWNIGGHSQYDIIYHNTASSTGLQYCIDLLNHEGKLIELSWYGDKKVNLSLGHNFHYKRLQIISSQVSVIPGHKTEETYKSRKDLALKYLRDESYDQLVTNRIPFENTIEFYHKLRQGNQENGIIYIIDYK